MNFRLLCWVYGENVTIVFEVKISRRANVGKVKEALYLKKSDTFRTIDANNLKLYSPFVPSAADRAVELGKWRLRGKEPLDVERRMGQVLPKRRNGKWVVAVNDRNEDDRFRMLLQAIAATRAGKM
ncbi:hypothetical protein EDD17DRAFT_1671699 [Pisolithus thermaeus]|nr:hypothetical protein EDD17DRAFT_1671699 [Pisolithus thermaeus]